MACYSCGYKGKLKNTRIKAYHYSESGLENVFLLNILAVKCPQCSLELPVFEKSEQLHQIIAQALFNKKFLLNGNEIRFLRTQLGYSQKDFSEQIGVAKEYMNRIENGANPVTLEFDKNIRIHYLQLKGTPKRNYDEVLNALAHSLLKKEEGVQKLRFKSQNHGWNIDKKAA